MDKRVKRLLKELTLDEKIEFASCLDDKFGYAKRLNLPGYRTCDNTNVDFAEYDFWKIEPGIREKLGGFFGTAFPPMSVLANSWNEELTEAVGEAQGREAKYGGVGMILRPGVNIKRSPLCGRNFEYFSEDPVLAGELAGSYIKGVQKNKVAACIKHFAANSQEYERMTTNAIISERALREIYLRAFEIAIKKGNPWTLMTSYNKVNGKYSHANHYMMGILRDEWNYDGVVMSDCMAVHYDKVEAHKAGLDVELEQSHVHKYQLRDALNSGEFSEKELNEIVRRVLELYFMLTDGEVVPKEIDESAHHALAVKAAEEGAVLLKNDGILPLDIKNKKLAVIGRYAVEPSYMGGGSGHMNGRIVECALDTIKNLVPEKQLLYADGYEIHEGNPPIDSLNIQMLEEAEKIAECADMVFLFAGYDAGVESEGYDRADLYLPESHRKLIERVLNKNKNVVLVISTASAVQLTEYEDRVRAILFSGYAGEGSGKAAANILLGLAEPGGRLAETFPMRVEDTPAYLNYPKYPDPMHDVVYGEDIYVGYRWYEARKIKPLYPFGYGLSYSTFAYSDLLIENSVCEPDSTVTVSLKVKNTGDRFASDVVQLYIRNKDAELVKVSKELKAFKKVHLESGEETKVTFVLGRQDFETYTSCLHKWVVEQGEYEILIGRSVENILLTGTVCMKSKEKAYGYDAYGASMWLVNSKNFEKAIRETMEPEAIEFFNNSPMAAMVSSLPWDRFKELSLGQGITTKKTINAVIDKLQELDNLD